MGQFVYQRAAACATRAGHGIIQQLATQGDAPGEGPAVHIGRQVITPTHLDL